MSIETHHGDLSELRQSRSREAWYWITEETSKEIFGEDFDGSGDPTAEISYEGLEGLVNSVFKQAETLGILVPINNEQLKKALEKAHQDTLGRMVPNIFGGEAAAKEDKSGLREWIGPQDITNVVTVAMNYGVKSGLLRNNNKEE
jgi:hypothetical protein